MLRNVIRATNCCGVHISILKCKINPLANGVGLLKQQKAFFLHRISTITTSALLHAKLYVDTENKFAHDIMERSHKYNESLAPTLQPPVEAVNEEEFTRILSSGWSDEKAVSSRVYHDFKKISEFSAVNKRDITEMVFDNLCKAVVTHQASFKDEELAGILSALSQWPETVGVNSRNFNDVWSAIDRQCVARCRGWDNRTLLCFADHWYQLNLLRSTKFMWHCIQKLTQKPKNLTPPNIVQCMFYINACRKMNPAVSLYELEFHIEQQVGNFSVDELAIIAMGFFKSQTRIRSPKICIQMIHKASNEANTISDITLSALLKAIRFSFPLSHAHVLTEMLDKFTPNIYRLSPLCCVHLALTGTNSQMFHKDILKAISQKLVSNIDELRIKDIERITFALTMFHYDPKTVPCFYRTVVDQLSSPHRALEMDKYPRSLVSTLHYLTLNGVFVEDLISKVLSPEFIATTYGSHHAKIARDILCLDVNVELERPGYVGNRLPPKIRLALGKTYASWSSPIGTRRRMTATEKLTVEVADSLEDLLGGNKNYFFGNVLPNSQRPDIVFSLSNEGLPLPMEVSFGEVSPGAVKRAPAGNSVCIVVGGWNSYIRDTEVPVGTLATKLRQLRAIGYKPRVIPWFEWLKVPAAERESYLHKKLMLARR